MSAPDGSAGRLWAFERLAACALASCAACGGGSEPARETLPISIHHAQIATIPLSLPNSVDGMHLAVSPPGAFSGARQVLVGLPDSHRDHPTSGHVLIVDIASSSVLRTLEPSERDCSFGAAVAWIPDLDGDGAPDIAVGAPHDYPPDPPGRVLLFSSATGALLRILPGIADGDCYGTSLAADSERLVVGCPGLADGSESDGGFACIDLRRGEAVYVVHASSGGGVGRQVRLVPLRGAAGSAVVASGSRDIECRTLNDGAFRWSYSPPAGHVYLAGADIDADCDSDGQADIVFSTRIMPSSMSPDLSASTLGILSVERGKCIWSAKPGAVAAVADGLGLICFDEHGLLAVERQNRQRSLIAGAEPDWWTWAGELYAVNADPARTLVLCGIPFWHRRAGVAGELHVISVR